MKRSHKNIMARVDDAVRWTGFPARVAEDMSDAPSVDRNHRPQRWIPLLYICLSCALLMVVYLILAPRQDQLTPGGIVGVMTAMVLGIGSGATLIYTSGQLGKTSREDDEREAMLRKDSFLFGLGLLAGLNCLGQPILLMLSHWQKWQPAFSLFVVFSVLTLNVTLLATLPTLYASWNSRRLPR